MKDYLIGLGNFSQDDATRTTVCQRWRKIDLTEPAWIVLRDKHKWGAKASGQAQFELKKLAVCNGIVRNGWGHYSHVEVCTSYRQQTVKKEMPDGRIFFEHMESWMLSKANWAHTA